jgi:hypothetical protein
MTELGPADRDAIGEVMARYCWHVDHSEWEAWLDLFAPDGAWGARDQRAFEGRDALAKLAAGLAKKRVAGKSSRHFLANALIGREGGEAVYRSYFKVVSVETGLIESIGEFYAQLAKRDGRWLIIQLVIDRLPKTAIAAETPAGAAMAQGR